MNETLTRPSEDTLLAALSLAGCGVLIHRGDAPLYANTELARLMGVDGALIETRGFSALDCADSAGGLREQATACLAGRASAIDALLVKSNACDSSGQRWLESRVARVEHDGAPAVLHTFHDVTDRRRFMLRAKRLRELFDEILSGLPVAAFVLDASHTVTHWNRAAELVTGVPAATLVGKREAWRGFYNGARPTMADIIVAGGDPAEASRYYGRKWRPSELIPDAYEAEGFFEHFGSEGRWLYFLAAPMRDAQGRLIGAIETLQDITDRKRDEVRLAEANERLEAEVHARTQELSATNRQLAADIEQRERAEGELLKRYAELTELNCKLHEAQEQLVQSEKLASIGQLAAGVAHEINNPIGYVLSNITTLGRYMDDLFGLFDAFERLEARLPADDPLRAEVDALKAELDFDFLKEDLPALLGESEEGASRVRKIVQDLKDFSRVDHSQEWMLVDIHGGIDSTLNVVNNEIKYKAEVVREYGKLPAIECMPSQLNQVFMNLLVNAAHAIEARGTITIRTEAPDPEHVRVTVSDTGSGIPEEVRNRIFEPFFTTKPVGKGTGLGLSLSYGIIQNHHGEIRVDSTVGKGTSFQITLPVAQAEREHSA